MRTSPLCVIAAIVMAVLAAGCRGGKPAPTGAPSPPSPATVSASKWFSVDKHDPWYWGCLIRITPDKGGRTHLKRNEEVAWVLVNDCDDSTDLEFKFFQNGKPVDSPITFDPVVNGVKRGVVRNLPDVPAGGLRFTYHARSGRHGRDPEIVIFP